MLYIRLMCNCSLHLKTAHAFDAMRPALVPLSGGSAGLSATEPALHFQCISRQDSINC
jgi:hypothetical protein